MLIRSSYVLTLSTLAACATAVPPVGGASADASRSSGGADGRADAADSPDGAPSVQPDAAPAGGCGYSGELATWSFTGQPGSQASTVAASSAPGVTAVSVSRASSLTAAAGSGSINASNWPTTAQLGATSYYTFSIKAPAGCTAHVTSVAVDAKSSGTGPGSAALATSADAFAHTAAVSTSGPSTATLSASSVGGSLEIRVYGYAATGAGGTMRLQNTLTVTGTLQ